MSYKLGARTLFLSVIFYMQTLFLYIVILYANTMFGPSSFVRAICIPDNGLWFAVIWVYLFATNSKFVTYASYVRMTSLFWIICYPLFLEWVRDLYARTLHVCKYTFIARIFVRILSMRTLCVWYHCVHCARINSPLQHICHVVGCMYNLVLHISLINLMMVDCRSMLGEVVHFVVLPSTPKYSYYVVCFFVSEPVTAHLPRFWSS